MTWARNLVTQARNLVTQARDLTPTAWSGLARTCRRVDPARVNQSNCTAHQGQPRPYSGLDCYASDILVRSTSRANFAQGPQSSELGTHKTVKARLWPCLDPSVRHTNWLCKLLYHVSVAHYTARERVSFPGGSRACPVQRETGSETGAETGASVYNTLYGTNAKAP